MLWSRNYDGDADAIFDTQTDIANAAADALVEVLPEEREALRRRLAPTRDASAFGAYLLGVGQMLHPQGERAREDAAGHFRSALAADAGFARAQAALCRMELWNFEANHDAGAFDKARLACLRARNMDPALGEVSLALGDLYRVQGNEKQALQYYDIAIDDPAVRWKALDGRAWLHVNQGAGRRGDERLPPGPAGQSRQRPGACGPGLPAVPARALPRCHRLLPHRGRAASGRRRLLEHLRRPAAGRRRQRCGRGRAAALAGDRAQRGRARQPWARCATRSATTPVPPISTVAPPGSIPWISTTWATWATRWMPSRTRPH